MGRRSIEECDMDADSAIKAMMAAVVGTAVIPAAVNWALTASAMGAGTVAIGKAYGVSLSKENGEKLVIQFIKGAGLWFLGMQVGSKVITAILQFTGLGYGAAVALDAATSAAFAWAIGATAKSYFRTEYKGGKLSKEELGEIFRKAFKDRKNQK